MKIQKMTLDERSTIVRQTHDRRKQTLMNNIEEWRAQIREREQLIQDAEKKLKQEFTIMPRQPWLFIDNQYIECSNPRQAYKMHVSMSFVCSAINGTPRPKIELKQCPQ